MDIKPIKTEQDYEATLQRIAELMGAEPETPDGDELDVLATIVSAHEDRNFPIGLEATKMIDTQHIKLLERRTKTPHPPIKIGCLQLLPSVERIAPQLPGLAEVVWWYASHDGRFSEIVELEELLVGPHIGTLMGDENRHIAEQFYSL